MDGTEAVSRFPQGFLLVDKPAGACWIYDWRDGQFVARSADPMPMQDGPADQPGDSRYRAAAEPHYDVLAAPWVGANTGEGADGGDPR
ncbi:hypothetical protein MED01_002405 [Micromonospora sp. MED01]|uniref:hypothetical protein n=1 Tax=Micromonospora alfalfae TaxID=2911212 RepID=UPI001EE8374B|nr:hypothetical protein [Micromonospora alfalfae]MCG5464240.1 hypothetical protein [Micromonospora alfalfae]